MLSRFSGQNVKFDGEKFNGTELTAVFGGVKCDLTKAIIEKDVVINATCIFGGVDIKWQLFIDISGGIGKIKIDFE